jgi:WS/DGAT/MGAT family acyltransferase
VPWQPRHEPGTIGLIAAGLRGALRGAIEVTSGAVDALTHPDRAVARAREAAEGIGEIVWAGLNPAPTTPLNCEIGPHRRYVVVPCRLDDLKLIKNAFGGTVNDVVLTVVSGSLRQFLHGRGVRTEGLELRALVPVSVRGSHEHHKLGNRIAVMRGPLPVYVADPLQRLRVVRDAMDGLKESKQALGAEVLAGVQNFAPPTVLAQASRLNFSTRLFNLIVTNIPGPQFALYMLGRKLEEVYPIAFLPRDHSLAIAIMSYNGQMNFGLLGDFDALPDIDRIAIGIEEGIAELVALAKQHSEAGSPQSNGAAKPHATTRA